ncbi:MAG: hypothetical protein IT371_16085 [Deltaproteobacteria bacterium]|nr:hypothetical protein [Deltaproteobacteria bacterium]
MASDHSSKAGWVLRQPLQIESLRRQLGSSERTDELLRQVQHYRENLDAVVYALSSRELASDRRQHLLEILQRHRVALDGCLASLGVPVGRSPIDPLFHFNQLDPTVRTHLAAILGVPEEPSFYEVLDIKAEEYLSQYGAFQAVAEQEGFKERRRLSRTARQGALMLTLSGSLIQISEPDAKGGRRYLYQNIYGNAHPPEGVLLLDRDVKVGHRVHSVELTTSPVRVLCVPKRAVPWHAQVRTFERLARTFTSLAGRSSVGLAGEVAAGSPFRLARRPNSSAAERVLKQEYGEGFGRFARLRQAFVDGEAEGKQEAEILTLCHYLQTAARELGFNARPVEEVSEFVTDEEHHYRIVGDRPRSVVKQLRGGGPEVVLLNISVGRQVVTCNAPLALISNDGALIEITAPVQRFRVR